MLDLPQLSFDKLLENHEALGTLNTSGIAEASRGRLYSDLLHGLFSRRIDRIAQILPFKAKIKLITLHAIALHQLPKLVSWLAAHPLPLGREKFVQDGEIRLRRRASG